jgi:eukaryotic-like serine/threonine-protein kinase
MTGRVLAGRYRLLELLGQGGMAVVYRARDEMLTRDVAVKVLRPAFAEDDAFVERFRREARNAAALLHPNIVTIHDTGVDARSGDFIVMSLVDGLDLREVIARDGPLAIGFTVRVGIETARALQFAHEHGIVHRDIKPANILIGQDGEARVADFGIARAASDVGGTTSGQTLGSAQYASPEQVSGAPVSPRSDVYSLGVVLYEALTGVRPFDGASPAAVALERLRVPPRPLREIRPDVPESLEAIVMRALEVDPESRHPSAAELAGELERFRITELGGIRRRGFGARAARAAGSAAGAAALTRARLEAGAAGWGPDPTAVVPIVPVDHLDDTVHEPAPSRPPTRGAVATRTGPRARGRRRAVAPAAAAAVLSLALLSIAVLAATASLFGRGLTGAVLGETSPPRDSEAAVVVGTPSAAPASTPSATPVSTPSATPSATPTATPTPTPVPTPAPTPQPTVAPTAPPTARPTARPTPQPDTGSTAPARDPAETVGLFYDLVERHEFDAAARLWTRSMRERYPPDGYIDGRFAPTTRIDITRLRIERMSLSAGTALVSVGLTEYRSSGPSPRRFDGSWELVLSARGWLMNEPHF